MATSAGTSNEWRHIAIMIVIAVAVTGYFTGLQSPMNPEGQEVEGTPVSVQVGQPSSHHELIQPARSYTEMRQTETGPNGNWSTSISKLSSSGTDLFAEITISPDEKRAALESRSMNRAFNGAPPTVPHPIDQMKVESCAVCHQTGALTASLRIPSMSHPWMANCTQCHVENNPAHMPFTEVAHNNFVGLPAPNGGPRAFDKAPPQMPHSTWMRENCMSCHGPTGQFGIRTTHPWRQNCEQCHTPSSVLEQTLLSSKPDFLPPPRMYENTNDKPQ